LKLTATSLRQFLPAGIPSSVPQWNSPPDRAGKYGHQRNVGFKHSKAVQTVEQWAVNKAVHYNAWAKVGKKDLEPAGKAFKDLLDCFGIYATRRVNPETLR